MLSFQCETQEEAQAVLTAVAAIGKEPHACSKQYIDSKQLLSNTPEQLGVTKTPEGAEPRRNTDPGPPSITKIGSGTKEALLADLKAGRQPDHAKFSEHLKLLWSRHEIKFDGELFYV